jgi:Zn-dependent protease with chaperone function
MMPDPANRSFAGLAGASLVVGMLALCGAVGCVLFALIVSRVAEDGIAAFADDAAAVWPALAFSAIVGAGAILGIASLRRQIRASRALSARVDVLALQLVPRLADAARKAGLAGRVSLLDSGERFSFAYGAFTPRVAVSSGLLEAAAPGELDAVLEHERYHVRNLDPLKVLLARALPATFYYVPILTGLRMQYVAGRELAADRRAIANCGRQPLAGALYKVLRGPAWPELQAGAAIGGSDLLGARLRQLESGSEPTVSRITPRSIALSLLAGIMLTALFAASIGGFGGTSAVADLTGDGLTLIDVGGALLCALPLVLGIWLTYRWLAWRTSRPPAARPTNSRRERRAAGRPAPRA